MSRQSHDFADHPDSRVTPFGHPRRATCNSSAGPSWRFRRHRRSGALPAGNGAKPSTPSTRSDDDQASHQRRPAFFPGQPVGVRRAPALQGLGAEIVELRFARVAVRRIGPRVPVLGVPAASCLRTPYGQHRRQRVHHPRLSCASSPYRVAG